jgi:hypothetical protein
MLFKLSYIIVVILVAAINTSFAYADFDTNRFGQGSIL